MLGSNPLVNKALPAGTKRKQKKNRKICLKIYNYYIKTNDYINENANKIIDSFTK